MLSLLLALVPLIAPFEPAESPPEHVDINTGHFYDYSTDLVVNCLEPIEVTRIGYEAQGTRWLFPVERMHVAIGNRNEISFIDLWEADGGKVMYYLKERVAFGNDAPYQTTHRLKKGDIKCNATGGHLSAQTYKQNYKLLLDSHDNAILLTTGSGETRLYTVTKRKCSDVDLVLAEVTKPNGNKLFYTYDDQNRLTKIRSANNNDTITFGWIRLEYQDDSPCPTTIFSSDGATLTYQYENDRLISISHDDQAIVRYEYISCKTKTGTAWRVEKVHSHSQGTTTFTYHHARIQHVDTPFGSYDLYWGKPNDDGITTNTVTDQNGDTTSYLICKKGIVHKIKQSSGPITRLHYDDDGMLDAKIVYDKSLKIRSGRFFVYDHKGNVIKEQLRGILTGKVDKPGRKIPYQDAFLWKGVEKYATHYQYSQDGFNNLLEETDGNTRTTYDYQPNTNLCTRKTTYRDDLFLVEETFRYDENAALLEQTINDGTSHFVKLFMRRTSEPAIGMASALTYAYYDENRTLIPLKTIRYHYNSHNQITQTDIFDANDDFCYSTYPELEPKPLTLYPQDDPPTNITYTARNQPLTITLPDGTTASFTYNLDGSPATTTTNDTSQLFDKAGRVIEQTEGDHRVTYGYDALSRICETHDYYSLTNYTRTTYAYDIQNNITAVHIYESDDPEPLYIAEYTYDDQNRCTSHTTYDIDLNPCTTTLTYDEFGAPASITDPEGHTTLIDTDYPNRTTTIIDPRGNPTTITFNEQNLPALIEQPGRTTTIAYDPAGNKIAQTTGNNTTTWSHDTYTHNGKTLTPTFSSTPATYTYDLQGRIIQAGDVTYTYDALYLRSVTLNDLTHHYTEYDKRGKCTLAHPPGALPPQQFTYDKCGRLTSSPHHTYTYDPCGNLIEHNDQTYTYDALNQLEYPIPPVPVTYNDLGCVIQAGDTTYTYDEYTLTHINNQPLTHTPHTQTPAHLHYNNTTYLVIRDHLGSPTHLYTPDGQLKQTFTYTPYGTSTASPISFTGAPAYPNTIQLGHRFYNPQAQQFLTPDPLLTATPYTYCNSNPLSFTDPTGLSLFFPSPPSFAEQYMNTMENFSTSAPPDKSSLALPFTPLIPSLKPSHDYSLPPPVPPSKNRSFNWDAIGPKKSFNGSLNNAIPMEPHYVRRPNLPFGLGFGFVNGMNTTPQQAYGHCRYLSDLTGGFNVNLTYNQTHGLVCDLLECHLNLRYHIPTNPAQLLQQQWDEFFDEFPDGVFIQVCHSQGCIHTKNALMSYDETRRKQIVVVAVAPPVFINPELAAEIVYIFSSRDPITWLDPRVREAANAIIVKPHPAAKLIDHSLQSPSVLEVLADQINLFIDRHKNQ